MTTLISLKHDFLQEISADIEAIRNNENLYREKNFLLRTQVLDDIEFLVTDRLQSFHENSDSSDLIKELMNSSEEIKDRLDEVNAEMFSKIREKIAEGVYKEQSLKDLINEYLDFQLNDILQLTAAGYDELDIFLNGILTHQNLPEETAERQPGMVYYQKTPARIVFEMISRAAFRSDDIFYDLGSGPGQVVMLVNLLTSIPTKGVEFEPAYCDYAKTRAAELNLADTEFLNLDARCADYSSGTVFFMYTPFQGQMLEEVLQKLFAEAKKRKIRIYTYGTCARVLTGLSWLIQTSPSDISGLSGFESV
jgi:hypothetical protein